MLRLALCEDGLNAHLEAQEGLWIVLSESENGTVLGRFTVDPSEFRQVVQGGLAFQATDGQGNSVSLEGDGGDLKVRLESRQHPTRRCKIERPSVENVLRSLNLRV